MAATQTSADDNSVESLAMEAIDDRHLQQLEDEAIYILRETAAECENPVMLYSMGKDSSVILHLALKAFYPDKPRFPLLHIDSTWEFREMIEFRDRYAAQELGLEVLVHHNAEGVKQGINPFEHGSKMYTDVMRTQPLREALSKYKFDAAIGGGRRDEERSRAKERIFSFRDRGQRWNPRLQRPELWNLYNTWKLPGESLRVFPLSNWTELDVWQYILRENIPIVPLYFARERQVVRRSDDWIVVDDDRMRLEENEQPEMRMVRFRTLGCYPVTGAVESSAQTLKEIVQEMRTSKQSERQGRAIDKDETAAMERKKREGYF